MFPNGAPPVKDEATEEMRRMFVRQSAEVNAAHPQQPKNVSGSNDIEGNDNDESNNEEPKPATRKKMPIPSSTMIGSQDDPNSSCFCDVSALSSAVPTISSGMMNLLAPIIEAALAEENAENIQPNEEQPTLCRALVPYRSPIANLAFAQYRCNASPSQEYFDENTPPVPIELMPAVAPKKQRQNEAERLSLFNSAIRRLRLDDVGQMAAGVELWKYRQKADVIDVTSVENNTYEEINSPENFED